MFYGSSSIRLWDTLAEDIDPGVVNLGFGGSTLQACDYFFERLVRPCKGGIDLGRAVRGGYEARFVR